jgi:hypothetical protein
MGNRRRGKKPIVVNLKYLNLLPRDTEVGVETLVKHRIVKKDETKSGVKILGGGELKVALKVALPVSRQAAERIRKAGGEVVGEAKTKKIASRDSFRIQKPEIRTEGKKKSTEKPKSAKKKKVALDKSMVSKGKK